MCGAEREGKEPCKLPAGHGTDHKGTGRCKFHGGSSPSGAKAAAKELAELARMELLAVSEIEEIDPADALMWSLHGAVALTKASQSRLRAAASMSPPDMDTIRTARETYEADLERQQKFAQSCIRLGIAERHVRMIERSGEQLLTLIRGVLDDLGIPMDQARPALLRRLSALGTTTVIDLPNQPTNQEE